MSDSAPTVAVYVVTFRRPAMLARALSSLRGQTYRHWRAKVINDDPSDERVADEIAKTGDDRISLFCPVERRGAAANFNFAFLEREAPLAAILEDDNWWEPEYLQTMIDRIRDHATVEVVVANERIWREEIDGTWKNTGKLASPDHFDRRYSTDLVSACGSSVLKNSALLFRTSNAADWRTPDDIPVDVTEHFRERLVPQPLLLIATPLVNYAETLTTHRSPEIWGEYQVLLIGSIFTEMSVSSRNDLAHQLWEEAGKWYSPRATSLLLSGLAVRSARQLWKIAPRGGKWRLILTGLRRPIRFWRAMFVIQRRRDHWQFLCEAARRMLRANKQGVCTSAAARAAGR